MIGRTFSHYRVLEKIGEGGMGVVYRARDERLDREVALKFLPSGILADESARNRFRKEALALAKVNHPHIAMIYDFDTQDGEDFLVMEFVRGESLSEKLASGPLREKDVVRIGSQIAEALQEAHDQGIVHRDLKPRNIVVAAKGQAKVLDFGLARLLQSAAGRTTADSIGATHSIAGTLPYMAPEQLQGEPADARTDIWALGAVLYEMAAARRAFDDPVTSRLTDAILHQPPVPPRAVNPRTSPGLEHIILKCLEKLPENRYQSAKEIPVDLRRLQDTTSAAPTRAATGADDRAPVFHRMRTKFVWLGFAAFVLLLCAAWLLWRTEFIVRVPFSRSSPAATPIRSIAVLPFSNSAPSPDSEYLTDGITAGIINRLSQLPDTRVLAPDTVFRFRSHQGDPQKIGRELNVEAVLTGKLTQRGDSLVIQTDLVKVSDGSELWGERYNRRLDDAAILEGDIAQEISDRLRPKLTGEERKTLARHNTTNPEAYQLYLKGRFYAMKSTKEGFAKGLDYFHQALEKDPNYALAYEGLAYYYSTASEWLMPPGDAMPKAKEAALKALSLDEASAPAHNMLGVVDHEYDRDWNGAAREFKRAIELAPAHQFNGRFLASLGRADEGVNESRKSLDLDPLSPEGNLFAGITLQLARRPQEAIDQFRKTIDLAPDFWWAHLSLGEALVMQGQFNEGISEIQKARELESDFADPIGGLAFAYARAGKNKEARKLLSELQRRSKQTYVIPQEVAVVYTALGDNDQAIAWLQKGCEVRGVGCTALKVSPQVDSLRSDPRFIALLQTLNFPP